MGEFRCIKAANGETVWRRNIIDENQALHLTYGMAASPLILDDKVIVAAGGARGKSIVAKHIAEIRNRRTVLDEQMKRLQAIKDWDTWLAIASKIPATRPRPVVSGGRLFPEGEGRRTKRFRTIKLDGRDILIGRGARENDQLTFDVAGPEDFWFHVADYSGSHVVVRNPGKEKDLEESVLVKAAELAAYFSQARNSSKVEVHYTRRKHVSKPRRAKPGLVRLMEFKSIKVEPKNWLNEG